MQNTISVFQSKEYPGVWTTNRVSYNIQFRPGDSYMVLHSLPTYVFIGITSVTMRSKPKFVRH